MNIAKTFLAIGIAVIFAVFISYGLYVVYEVPKDYSLGTLENNSCYKDYNCQQKIYDCQKQSPDTSDGYESCYSSVTKTAEYKTCLELYEKCDETFQKQTPRYIHSRNSFFILSVIGIVAIIIGLFLTKLQGVGSGIMGGGILIILWSLFYTYQYWFTLNKYVKLGVLGVVLIILIYLGYKKLENKLKQQGQ